MSNEWIGSLARALEVVEGQLELARTLRLGLEFYFVNIDHAVYNVIDGGRMLTCPRCAAVVRAGLVEPKK